MRWQDALIHEARSDFEAYLTRERDGAIERLLRAQGSAVVEEQMYVKALDRVRHALVMVEREEGQHAGYRRAAGFD